MPRPFSALLILLAAASLAGCSAIASLDRAATPLDAFELRAPAEVPVARTPQGIDLVVEVPSASGAIDVDRILIRPGAVQVAYLPDARWTAPAPVMLQSALVETFLRSNAFRFVGRRPLGVSGDIALVSDLVDFGAEVQGDGAVVEVTLVARLVREQDAAITATRTFTRNVPVPDTQSPTILAGFEAATNALLVDVATWVLAARGIPAGAS
jgi:cholesterol transport system auxiliary component